MPFIPVANGVELVIDFTPNNGKIQHVVLGVRVDAPAALATLIDITKAVADFIGSEIIRPWSSFYAVTGIKASALDTVASPSYQNTVGGTVHDFPIAGTITGNAATSQVAVVNTLQTGNRGRSYRGRNYWPGVPFSYLVDDSTITPAAVLSWDVFIDDFIAFMSSNTTPIVVISRHADHAPRVAGVMTPVLDCRAEAKLGTQRRRVAGVFGS